MLAFYAGVASPLLELFGVSNFVVDLAGRTTSGKTTMLQMIGSIWGCPDEHAHDAVVHGMDMTAKFFERAAGVLRSLPLLVDDTKLARDTNDIGRMIYATTVGRGRGRGTIQGVRETETWRTITIMTGEQSVVRFRQDGGARARGITLWGSPFGIINAETGQIVADLRSKVLQHYGHAGPRFIQYLLDHRDDLPQWREEFAELAADYDDLAGSNPILQRQAPMFAVIAMAAQLAHRALALPWDYRDPVASMWDQLSQEQSDSDLAWEALRQVYEWCVSNEVRFSHDGTGGQPPFTIAEQFCQQLRARVPDLERRLVKVQTPRPGLHMWYRCQASARSAKLASAVQADSAGNIKRKTLIETKGVGGYCVSPPTAAVCHKTGRHYRVISEFGLAAIPEISAEERQFLLNLAQEFDQRPRSMPVDIRGYCRGRNCRRLISRPGEAFNVSACWAEILRGQCDNEL